MKPIFLPMLTLASALLMSMNATTDSSVAAPIVEPPAAMSPDDGEDQSISRGTIKSVDLEARSFTLGGGEKDQTIRCDEKTIFMIDGKIATMEDAIKVDRKVTVTHKKELASKVEAENGDPKR